jgi:CIC family chloride channel protein
MRDVPVLRADDSLEDAIGALGATDDDGLPVLGADSERVVGWITHRRLLSAYRGHVASEGGLSSPEPAAAPASSEADLTG